MQGFREGFDRAFAEAATLNPEGGSFRMARMTPAEMKRDAITRRRLLVAQRRRSLAVPGKRRTVVLMKIDRALSKLSRCAKLLGAQKRAA